jgi:hypothetical protein
MDLTSSIELEWEIDEAAGTRDVQPGVGDLVDGRVRIFGSTRKAGNAATIRNSVSRASSW